MAMFKRLLKSEDGFAVPSVLLMTVAAMGIASVGVMASIQGQSGTVRDQGSKTALAVAESGVDQALLHYNRGVAPCAPATEGDWCGPVTGMSVNGGTVFYWARLASGEECGVGNEVECVEIVSQGTVGGVTRRVDVYASTVSTEDSTGGGPFASASVLSLDTIELDSNSKIHTGTATNGNMILKSNSKQCGQASVGIGKKLETSSNAGYYSDSLCKTKSSTVLQQELTLPPVNQGDAATNNDNARFFALDTVSGNKADACWAGKNANGKTTSACGTRELRVDNNSAVTLGGSVYSFCKLTLRSNSALYIAAGADVTIYFDSPEACGYSSGVTQLDLQSNSRITSATGDPISVAMLFVGSETRQTKVQLNSNTSVNGPCEQNFVIYAPRSDVDLDSNSRFCGAVAGKTVHLDSNAEIWTASGSDDFTLPGVEIPETPAHYTPYRFVECSAVTASPPNAGC
ncbi:MAG TPA: hypothetical protein VIS95_05730 [Solirubrobacterales bacterium]